MIKDAETKDKESKIAKVPSMYFSWINQIG